MPDTRNTYVITLEEDVAEFLDVKHKSASELNSYINQVLHQEKQRQSSKQSMRQPSPEKGRSAKSSDWTI